MKNDIEALRGFANEVLNYSDSSVIDGFAIDFGLLDNDGEKTEILTGSKDSISDSQRRLYWAWITDMAKTKVEAMGGRTKDCWHWEMKLKYLVPIFVRDDSEFAEMHNCLLRVLSSSIFSDRQTIKEKFYGNLSITDATKEQSIEYLYDIERFCHNQGIMLRTDSHLYKTAMGIK